MAARFKVGTLVIMQHGTVFTEFDGFLALIVDRGKYRRAMNLITMKREWHYLYRVKVIKELDEFSVNKGHLCVRPWQIRPLRGSTNQELVTKSLGIPTIVENTFATL